MGTVAVSQKNAMLDALVGRTTYTATAAVYAKLHIGSPGSAGTSNPASNTERKQVTFGNAASGGEISNTAAVEWTNVPANETCTHVSFWSDESGGAYLFQDDLPDSKDVSSGDTFRIGVGVLTIRLPDSG